MARWPHVYTVRDWWSSDGEFSDAGLFIEQTGVACPWPPPPAIPIYHNRYLVLGDLMFWAMGPRGDQDHPRQRTVLNCALAAPAQLANYADVANLNQTGAWSDLSTRLSGLIHSGSSRGASTTSWLMSGVAKT